MPVSGLSPSLLKSSVSGGQDKPQLSHHPSAEWGTRTRAISLTPGLAWGPQQPLPHTAPSPGDISDSWDRAAEWGRAQNQHGVGGRLLPVLGFLLSPTLGLTLSLAGVLGSSMAQQRANLRKRHQGLCTPPPSPPRR